MSQAGGDADLATIMAEARRPSLIPIAEEKRGVAKMTPIDSSHELTSTVEGGEPTPEDLASLRRVSGRIPWLAFTVAFVELCERFSYYGTTAVFVNFIQRPRPSSTGALALSSHPEDFLTSGALDQGQRASTGLTLFNSFWSYVMPLVGGWIADTYLGRFATIQYSIGFSLVGHVILIVSALPRVIDNPSGALGCFVVGLIIMGIGTGGFKSNIAPLIAEQVTDTRMKVITLRSGERVIQDPSVTVSRIFLYFYLMINIGSLIGQIAMVFAEKYVGFWLSYMLPTCMFLLCPLVLLLCYTRYIKMPPTGSVVSKAFKLWGFALKGKISLNPSRTFANLRDPNFWEDVKPSKLGAGKPAWMTFDDVWVDQVARGLDACKVFLWYPLYWLAYNQITNNLTSQSATLILNGVPSDIINNLNPLSLIIFIPIFDQLIYPSLRKAGIRFTPLKRITLGFFLGSAAMISACVLQYYIYKTSPCGTNASGDGCDPAPINVWVQTLPYVLIGFSEIMASITGLEYAFTKAPENMRSLVQGVFLLQTAFASAIGQALVSLSADPLLVWNYGVVAVLAAVGGVGFWFSFRKLDAREDELNMIGETEYKGRKNSVFGTSADPEFGRGSYEEKS